MGEMPGPPSLLLLLLLRLVVDYAGAAPLPQTGAGERAAAGTGLRSRCGGVGATRVAGRLGLASTWRDWRPRRG